MSDEQLKRAFRALVAPNTDADDWRKFSSAMSQTANERTEMYVQAIKERDAALSERDALAAENARLREALTPSAETKAAYIGEFKFREIQQAADGDEWVSENIVPWTTIKEIMAAIRARALVEAPR